MTSPMVCYITYYDAIEAATFENLTAEYIFEFWGTTPEELAEFALNAVSSITIL